MMTFRAYFCCTAFILLGIAFSCNAPKTALIDELNELDSLFADYEFGTFMDIYLQVYSHKPQVDTSEIKEIYDKAISVKDSVNGTIERNRIVPWVYLNLYDKNERFMFQLYRSYRLDGEFKISSTEYY